MFLRLSLLYFLDFSLKSYNVCAVKIRVDGQIFESAKKNLRVKRYLAQSLGLIIPRGQSVSIHVVPPVRLGYATEVN